MLESGVPVGLAKPPPAAATRFTIENVIAVRHWTPKLVSFQTSRAPGFRFTPRALHEGSSVVRTAIWSGGRFRSCPRPTTRISSSSPHWSPTGNEDDVPPDQSAFTALNAELAKVWKPIIEMKPALPDADEWAQVKSKLDQLKR
jgi:hypothetical protein